MAALKPLVCLLLICTVAACARRDTVRSLENRIAILEDRLEDTQRRLAADETAAATVEPPAQGTITADEPIDPAPVAQARPAPAQAAAVPADDSPEQTTYLMHAHAETAEPADVPLASEDIAVDRTPLATLTLTDGEADARYKQALNAYYARDFDTASNGFLTLLSARPDHRFAPNAAYWLGEVHYSVYAWNDALAAFQRVVDDYPASHKVADALYKIAKTHEREGRIDAAMDAYRKLVTRFPESRAAAMARQYL